MKFSVEVDIDWISEEGGVDEQVSYALQEKLTQQIMASLKPEVKEKVEASVSSILDSKVSELFNEFMERSFTIYDSYGDAKEEVENVKSLLKKKLDTFMTEKVGADGKPSQYNGKFRYLQILDQQGKKQVEDFLSKLSKEVISGIKADINEEARKKITSSILTDYDLKKLINPLN